MSQSQEIVEVPDLVIDEESNADKTPPPPPSNAANEVNQAPSTPATSAPAASAVPAKPQKPKKRTYTKRGGASASDKVQEDSDEDEVCVDFIFFTIV